MLTIRELTENLDYLNTALSFLLAAIRGPRLPISMLISNVIKCFPSFSTGEMETDIELVALSHSMKCKASHSNHPTRRICKLGSIKLLEDLD